MLEINGYEVKTREVKYIKTRDGKTKLKGNLDAEMIVDMVTRTRRFDTAIVFSGDSDFTVVLDYLKKKNKRVLVASVKEHSLIKNPPPIGGRSLILFLYTTFIYHTRLLLSISHSDLAFFCYPPP